MQLCFVVSHSLTTVSFCFKDLSLCCIASYDALRLIFYNTHLINTASTSIFVILSSFTQGQMFGINFHCSVVAVSTPSSHSVSTAIYQFHPGEPNRDITTTLLVGVDSSPLNCSGFTSVRSLYCARRAFHLNAHVSTERKSSSSDTLLHESFSFVLSLITNVWPQHAHTWCQKRHSHQMSNDATQWF